MNNLEFVFDFTGFSFLIRILHSFHEVFLISLALIRPHIVHLPLNNEIIFFFKGEKIMNWEAIGAIAELLGAIGVVLTLIYLAIQIRQNTRSQENSSRVAATNAFTGWYTSVMSDPDLVRIWRVGHTKPGDLSEDDINRFMWMLSSIGYRIEESFTKYESGLLDEDLWVEYRDLMASFLHNSIA